MKNDKEEKEIFFKGLRETLEKVAASNKENFSDIVLNGIGDLGKFFKHMLIISCCILKTGCEMAKINEIHFRMTTNKYPGFLPSQEMALKENYYTKCIVSHLDLLKAKKIINNYKQSGNAVVDIKLDDENNCNLELMASGSASKESEHVKKFKDCQSEENWLLHAVTLPTGEEDVSERLMMEDVNLNIVYMFNNMTCSKKKFYFRMAHEKEYRLVDWIETPKIKDELLLDMTGDEITIETTDQQSQDKDQEIKRLNQLAEEKDQLLSEKDQLLSEKDAEIERLNKRLRESSGEIEEESGGAKKPRKSSSSK